LNHGTGRGSSYENGDAYKHECRGQRAGDTGKRLDMLMRVTVRMKVRVIVRMKSRMKVEDESE
jgi:hypothetical protein